MKIQQIETMGNEGRYEEAFAACNELLMDPSVNSSDVLRTRAHLFALYGDYESALRDYEGIFQKGDGTIRDYYQAGFRALGASQTEKAFAWFQTVIRLGEEQGESWFRSGTLFYLSFASMERGRYKDALGFLDDALEASPDVGMPIPRVGLCDHVELRKEIQLRQKN